ncbi:hypothetical protein U1Q18_020816, partial [Sarracenia purpurea var. burkii]
TSTATPPLLLRSLPFLLRSPSLLPIDPASKEARRSDPDKEIDRLSFHRFKTSNQCQIWTPGGVATTLSGAAELGGAAVTGAAKLLL